MIGRSFSLSAKLNFLSRRAGVSFSLVEITSSKRLSVLRHSSLHVGSVLKRRRNSVLHNIIRKILLISFPFYLSTLIKHPLVCFGWNESTIELICLPSDNHVILRSTLFDKARQAGFLIVGMSDVCSSDGRNRRIDHIRGKYTATYR